MTTENKNNILDYISGTLTPTAKDEKEIFLEQEEIARSEWENYLPISWNDFRFEGMVAGNELTTNLTVLYGGYLYNNNVYGIIILVDENFKPVKTIYEYDSGAKLRYIQYMKQAEDGTFYFIDDTAFTYSQKQQVMTSQKRFVMTNNFTISSDYSVKLRTSYIFSGNYVNFYCKNMFKDPNSSHYIFFGSAADPDSSSYLYRYLKIIDLKVNVGESNTWIMYANEDGRLFGSAIATFEGENVRYRCLSTNVYSNDHNIALLSKTYTGSPTSSVVVTFENYKPYIDDTNYKKQSVFLDYDNVYFVQNNQHWGTTGISVPKHIGLYKYDFSKSRLTTIIEKSLGNYDFCNLEAMYIDRCNTDIYVQYNTNIISSSPTYTADYYFQRLKKDVWKPILIGTNKYFVYNQRTIFIKNNFNLLQVYSYATNARMQTWYQYFIKEDYNALNYNGESYKDYNSILSQKGRLYSNNKIVFARNLYNRTTYNNSTTSTIQIPNTYFNDIPITAKRLLSYTNSTIDYDTHQFTKNIYESVLLNFIDSIYVTDEDTEENYPLSANYINQNINVGTKNNYDITNIGKVRINYADGDRIMPIVWTGTTTKEAKFTIYVSSEVNSIDFLSNDEIFTYITKKYNNLEIGKYYTITQKIRIE